VQQAFCALRSGGQLAQLAIALLIALDRYWRDPGPVTGRTPGTPCVAVAHTAVVACALVLQPF